MKILLFVVTGICLGMRPAGTYDSNCDRIEAVVEISPSSILGKHKAIVKVKGARSPEFYIFYHPNGHLIDRKHDVSSNTIDGLSKGQFFCSVTDDTGCVKKVEFTVE